MIKKLYLIICILLAYNYSNDVNAQAGALDVSFDTDGRVNTPFGSGVDSGNSIALQSDGKIVVAGTTKTATNTDFAVSRYNSDGSLDVSFDSDGKVTTDIGAMDDKAYSVAIQSDGKIVVAGSTFTGSNTDFAIVRYNTDGSLDITFDVDGIIITDLGATGDIAYGVALQSDGMIVATGSIDNSVDLDIATLRYNTNGSLDNTFDTDGIVITDFFGNSEEAKSIAIQTDGKIVVGGWSDYGSFDFDFAAVRYNTNGSLDNTFSSDGKAITGVAGNQDIAYSVSIQTDGKIVLAGQTNPGADYNIAVVRYNTNGSEDATFSTDGIVTNNIGSLNDRGYAVKTLSDGKILVAGTIDRPMNNDLVVLRYNANGSLDNSFDSDGISFTDYGGDDYGYGLVVQTDGKILVAGMGNTGSNDDFAIARFLGDFVGLEENTFSSNIVVAPNPTEGLITISMDHTLNNASVKLLNLNSEILLSEKDVNGNSITINLSLEPAGVYFLEIAEGTNTARVKVIKN